MRLLIWTVAGLLIGILAHLLSIIALPRLSSQTGFERVALVAGSGGFTIVSPEKSPLPMADPAIVSGFCHYNLVDGAIRLHAPVTGSFLSISFYTSAGLNFYSLTDRAAANGSIDLGLYTAAQLAKVRADEGPDQPGSLRLQAPQDRGLVALRALIPEPGQRKEIENALAGARCGRG